MGPVRKLRSGLFAGVAAVERRINRNNVAKDVPLSEIRHFLLLYHASALGTAIHATPLIPALHHAVPDCRITVAASGFSFDILKHNPGIDRLIETPNPLKDLRGAVRALRNQLDYGATAYATLTPVGNERTMVAMQALLSGASSRVGFTLQPELYRVPMSFDYAVSQIANNLRIVGSLGHTPVHCEPQIFFSDQDLGMAHGILDNAKVGEDQPVAVFITQTSVTQRKSWRAERFREAAVFLQQRHGAHILFVGTSAEAQAIEKLRDGLPFPATSVAGKTTLPQLAALMSLCSVGLSLDTGPMHVGRAVGLPMVIVAPAWSPPIEWLPLGDERFCILKNAEMRTAPQDYIIDEVGTAEVIAALERLLSHYPRRRIPWPANSSVI